MTKISLKEETVKGFKLSRNRDKELDRVCTRELILTPGRPQYSGGANWLGHGVRSGRNAYVDELLLEGAPMERQLKERGAVRQHFDHLAQEHDLLVEEIDGRFRFDRKHLGITDLTSDKKLHLRDRWGSSCRDTNKC
jgi:hypothetical protein